MCGIAGFFGHFSQALLEEMTKRIAHRGPDGQGIYFSADDGIGLGHRRLSIIDLSEAAAQPMWDKYNQVALIYNGEIYNYKQLKRELEQYGREFHSTSDTEVLLQAYLQYGHKVVHKLNGIFTFAIWDTRSRELFIARDHFGVKPLYYAELQNGIIFGSEIKALLACPTLNKEIDIFSVRDYVSLLWSPAPRTILKQVKKLPPGSAMRIAQGQIKELWQYYDPVFFTQNSQLSIEAATKQLGETLHEAVSKQLMSDVPVGAFLSGGLDSSSLAVYAQQELNKSGKTLDCFTIGVDSTSGTLDSAVDDLPYAKRVAKHLNINLHIVPVSSNTLAEFPSMIEHLDEPVPDPAAFNLYAISKLSREMGIKVLLSGAAGDDILSGYRRHLAIRYDKYLTPIPRPLIRMLAHSTHTFSNRFPLIRQAQKLLSALDSPNIDHRIVNYFGWLSKDLVNQTFTAVQQSALSTEPVFESLLAPLRGLPKETTPLQKMLYLDTKFFLGDHNLGYTDKMGMANGVEIRVPFLDLELTRLCLSLPESYRWKKGVSKWLLRKAMEPYLPNDVLYRPKTGFGMPLRAWLKTELRDIRNELLSKKTIERRGLFSFEQVARMQQLTDAGQLDASYPLFSMMTLELWCQQFIDKQT